MTLSGAGMRRAVLHLPVLLLFIACLPLLSAGGKREVPSGHLPQVARAAYARLPLSFEEVPDANGGATTYMAHGPGYALWLNPAETVLSLSEARRTESAYHAKPGTEARRTAVLRTR